MTRKDFELIAATLLAVRGSYGKHWNPNLFRACDDHAKAFAEVLASANPAFKRDKFLTAAGVSQS